MIRLTTSLGRHRTMLFENRYIFNLICYLSYKVKYSFLIRIVLVVRRNKFDVGLFLEVTCCLLVLSWQMLLCFNYYNLFLRLIYFFILGSHKFLTANMETIQEAFIVIFNVSYSWHIIFLILDLYIIYRKDFVYCFKW